MKVLTKQKKRNNHKNHLHLDVSPEYQNQQLNTLHSKDNHAVRVRCKNYAGMRITYMIQRAKVIAMIMCQCNEMMETLKIHHGEQYVATLSLKKGVQKFGKSG